MEKRFRITVDGRPYVVTVEDITEGGSLIMPEPGSMHVPSPVQAAPVRSAPQTGSIPAAGPGDVTCTIGGVVDAILVNIGQNVSQGDKVITIEAMKMKSPLVAPRAGKVTAIAVKPGDAVVAGQVLITIG